MKFTYTEPKIKTSPIFNPDGTKGKRWYVWFRIDGTHLKRYYLGINETDNYEKRLENAIVLREALKRKLQSGWNPCQKETHEIKQEKLRISQALDFALEKLQKRVSKKTYSGYSGTCRFINDAVKKLKYGNLYINKLERVHVKLIFDEIKQQRNWSNTAYNKNLNYFKAILTELIEYDVISSNPAHGIKSLKQHDTNANEPLTDEEQTEVINYLSKVYPTFLIYCKMLYHTGIRPVELLSLKCSNIDLQKELIYLDAKITKTDKNRIVPIVPDLKKDLEKLDISKPDYFLFGTHRKQGGKLNYDKTFCPNPYQMKRDTATKKWKQLIIDDLGINKTLYSLKHKGANDKLKSGVSLEAVKEIFGHSDTKITEIYAKIIKVMRFDEAKAVAGKFE